ncbi:MAG: 6-carboxytetrahydropterin synthase [Phycisphaerae bacterium]|nr:6-carboxytetrahydropterin synthase [Phycisphaerae bacterium]
MFSVEVTEYFWAGHQLNLPDGSKEPYHAHNWRVTARVSGEKLNKIGLLVDFLKLKKMLKDILEPLANSSPEQIPYFQQNNPSAEEIARYIYNQLASRMPGVVKIIAICVEESSGCIAEYSE